MERTQQINVRVSPEEKLRLAKAAGEQTLSEYLRTAGLWQDELERTPVAKEPVTGEVDWDRLAGALEKAKRERPGKPMSVWLTAARRELG